MGDYFDVAVAISTQQILPSAFIAGIKIIIDITVGADAPAFATSAQAVANDCIGTYR